MQVENMMEILQYTELAQGGFAGLLERRFVMDSKVFKRRANAGEVDGIGNFVYLADANFKPFGETGMHPHKEIDVISVMVHGQVAHKGSLEHGASLNAGDVQVQRAGAQGFSHNEVNPNSTPNQMIQLWVLPDNKGEKAGYKVYQPQQGNLVKIYGGDKKQQQTFHSNTSIYVANANSGQEFNHPGEAMAYLSKGAATINGKQVMARSLIRVKDGLIFKAKTDAQLIIIS